MSSGTATRKRAAWAQHAVSAASAAWMIAGVAAPLAGCEGQGSTPAAQAEPAAAPKAAAPTASGPVLATYEGKSFTLGDYRAAAEGLNARARKSLDENPERRKQFIENHLLSRLVFEEGVRKGYDKDAEVERKVAELREHLVVQHVMEDQQGADVTDAEVKAYYDAHPAEFSTEKVKASHILVDNEALAKEIYAKLKADKGQFAALASEHSKDLSNAKRGGDLGAFSRGRMVKEFEDAAFALPKDGDLSEPVQTRFGWHIIMRTGREDGSVQPFDQVKNQIKVKLTSDSRREKTTTFVEDLKKKAGLSIDDKAVAEATTGGGGKEDDGKAAHSGH